MDIYILKSDLNNMKSSISNFSYRLFLFIEHVIYQGTMHMTDLTNIKPKLCLCRHTRKTLLQITFIFGIELDHIIQPLILT